MPFENNSEAQVDKSQDAKSQEGHAALAQQAWGPQAAKDQPRLASAPTDAQQQQQLDDGFAHAGDIYGSQPSQVLKGGVQVNETAANAGQDSSQVLKGGVQVNDTAANAGQDSSQVLKGGVQVNDTAANPGQKSQGLLQTVVQANEVLVNAAGKEAQAILNPLVQANEEIANEIDPGVVQAVTKNVSETTKSTMNAVDQGAESLKSSVDEFSKNVDQGAKSADNAIDHIADEAKKTGLIDPSLVDAASHFGVDIVHKIDRKLDEPERFLDHPLKFAYDHAIRNPALRLVGGSEGVVNSLQGIGNDIVNPMPFAENMVKKEMKKAEAEQALEVRAAGHLLTGNVDGLKEDFVDYQKLKDKEAIEQIRGIDRITTSRALVQSETLMQAVTPVLITTGLGETFAPEAGAVEAPLDDGLSTAIDAPKGAPDAMSPDVNPDTVPNAGETAPQPDAPPKTTPDETTDTANADERGESKEGGEKEDPAKKAMEKLKDVLEKSGHSHKHDDQSTAKEMVAGADEAATAVANEAARLAGGVDQIASQLPNLEITGLPDVQGKPLEEISTHDLLELLKHQDQQTETARWANELEEYNNSDRIGPYYTEINGVKVQPKFTPC